MDSKLKKLGFGLILFFEIFFGTNLLYAKAPKSMHADIELGLHINKEKPGRWILRTTVTNRSKAAIYFPKDYLWHHSEIKIKDPSGQFVKTLDSRSLMTMDGSAAVPDPSSFVLVEPQKSVDLETGQILLESGKFGVTWYPFGADLKPGRYKFGIHWKATYSYWIDDQGKKIEPPNIFVGEIDSNEVEIDLH